MKKFLAVLAAVLLLSAPSFAAAKFVSSPSLGVCTGDYVRYREDSDTNAEIVGRLNTSDKVIVYNHVKSNGEVWHEIDDPRGSGLAYVFGKYVVPAFSENVQKGKPYELMIEVLQVYGLTRERGKLYEGPKARVKYDDKGYLTYLEVERQGCAFGDIKIGDDRAKVKEVLNDPDSIRGNILVYEVDDDTEFNFILEDGQVAKMSFKF